MYVLSWKRDGVFSLGWSFPQRFHCTDYEAYADGSFLLLCLTESHRVEDTIEQAAILHFANTSVQADDFSGNRNVRHHRSDEELEEDENGMSDESADPPVGNSCANRTLVTAAQELSELPDNVRSALRASEKLLLHVGEERQKAQAFERYLEKALQGETPPEMDASPIFPAANTTTTTTTTTPRVVRTPALLPLTTTPSGIHSAPGQRGARAAAFSAQQDFGPTPQTLRFSSSLLAREGLRQDRAVAGEEGAVGGGEGGGVEGGDGSCREGRPLSQCLEQLKEDLQAQRYANQLFEKRLKSFLES